MVEKVFLPPRARVIQDCTAKLGLGAYCILSLMSGLGLPISLSPPNPVHPIASVHPPCHHIILSDSVVGQDSIVL